MRNKLLITPQKNPFSHWMTILVINGISIRQIQYHPSYVNIPLNITLSLGRIIIIETLNLKSEVLHNNPTNEQRTRHHQDKY